MMEKIYSSKLVEKGWSIISDAADKLFGEFTLDKLYLHPFVMQNEEYVTGNEMLRRARQSGSMVNHKRAIDIWLDSKNLPVFWNDYKIILPGTLWCSKYGELHCPYLFHHKKIWHLSFYWLSYDFHHDSRFLKHY